MPPITEIVPSICPTVYSQYVPYTETESQDGLREATLTRDRGDNSSEEEPLSGLAGSPEDTGTTDEPPKRPGSLFRNLSSKHKKILAVALAAALVLASFALVYTLTQVPTSTDWDGDGCPNDWELRYGLDPKDALDAFGDLDGDQLSNGRECELGTVPTDPDTDGDRLLDGEEVSGYETLQGTWVTDPLKADTDGDDASDGEEVLDYHRFDRIETEDFFSGINATRYLSSVAQLSNISAAPSSESELTVEMNIPTGGDYKIKVSGIGRVTYERLKLNSTTFGIDDLSSQIIVNAPIVTVLRNTTQAVPLAPYSENRTWVHLYTDTQGTEEGIRLEDMEFRAHVATFWEYTGVFLFEDVGEYSLSLAIRLPPDETVLDPQFRPLVEFITTLEIETGFFRIWRRTIDPLDPDVDKDTLLDGFEDRNFMYPLNPDPDEDGISDPFELDYGTNDELRDSDLDGIRDSVEIGRDGVFSDPHTEWDVHPANVDGDSGATTTDPNDVDSDDDGLPDGFVDGWSFDEERGWGFFGQRDTARQMWEGEDFDLDGVVDSGPWNKGQGPGETDPNLGDTDGDLLPEAWEVSYEFNPTSSVGQDGANGNPDHDAAVREHSLALGEILGVSSGTSWTQTFKATEQQYDNLVIWARNDPLSGLTESLEVRILGTTNGVPDPNVYENTVATVSIPLGHEGELNISLGAHSLTVGETYGLWLKQQTTVLDGTLELAFATEGLERTGSLWFGINNPVLVGDPDLYFYLLRWGGVGQLTNLGEYIAGTHPRNPDTDSDGAGDWPEARVMYRTNIPEGGKVIDHYGSVAEGGGYEWIWFAGKEYGFEAKLEDPTVDFEGASANNSLVALLQPDRASTAGASSIVVSSDSNTLFVWRESAETSWTRTFYLWEVTGATYRWSAFGDINGNGMIDSTVFVYSLSLSQGQAETSPYPNLEFKDQEIYFTDPFSGRTDWDRYPDGVEPLWSTDIDADGLVNARDTDSDGDGVADDNEIRAIWISPNWVFLNDVDGDGLDTLIDPDSDGDGILDGLEYFFHMDIDWDGYENMVDNDIDNDGIPDGWMDGYQYDPVTGTFVYDPIFDDSIIQAWEGEDTNLNGEFEPSLGETDPQNPDSDGDGLWDGFSVDVPVGRYRGFHPGELTVGTDAMDPDSDGDNVPDGTEVLGWFRIHVFPPPLVTSNPLMVDTDSDGLGDYLEYTSRLTDPSSPDTDGDGLGDAVEDANQNGAVDPGETRPYAMDSDFDFLLDGLELGVVGDSDPSSTTDPLNSDSDGDGLRDGLEDTNRNGAVDANEADPNDPDTDGDGIADGPEFRVLGNGDQDGDGFVNLRDVDSDGDGILDGDDLWRDASGTWVPAWSLDFDGDGLVNALDSDSDDDLLSDSTEDTNLNGRFEPGLGETNPLSGDQDGDGLKDGIEAGFGLDSSNSDTDGDGILDGYEQSWNVDTDGDGAVNANDTDSDNDGLADGDEDKDLDGIFEPGGGDSGEESSPTIADTDGDGLNDYKERLNGTNPLITDTDGDGLEDGPEVNVYGTNATNPLTDGDLLTDGEEVLGTSGYVTDPLSSDTDSDELYDHLEIDLGYNPTNPDMDGDGLTDGKDLQPLASWPDLYSAPVDLTNTLHFGELEYTQLLDYGAAADMGFAELALAIDQGQLIAPSLPVKDFAGDTIGTSTFAQSLIAYTEVPLEVPQKIQVMDHKVISHVDSMFRDEGYKVKVTPGIWSRNEWAFDSVAGLSFGHANFTITFENFREVPSPGGFFHNFLTWDLLAPTLFTAEGLPDPTPSATNVITVQFSVEPAYDESFESLDTSFRLPGYILALYRWTGPLFVEVMNQVFVAKPLGEHHYRVDLGIPPEASSEVLRWPHEMFVVDLIPVWVEQDAVTGNLSVDPLVPYRYEKAQMFNVRVLTSDHASASLISLISEQLLDVLELLGLHNLSWDDVFLAKAVLDWYRSLNGVGSFAELIADADLPDSLKAVVPELDWDSIHAFVNAVSQLGVDVVDLLDALDVQDASRISDISVAADFYGWDPIQVLRVTSISTVAKHGVHMLLPKENISLEEAIADFDSLSLDLTEAATQTYQVGSRNILFYNGRNAVPADYGTLTSLAETGSGADILVISALSERDLVNLTMLNWSGTWSSLVDDSQQSAPYLGNYTRGAIERHVGHRQIRPFIGALGRDVFANGTFYYDPGDVLEAEGNASALPAPSSESLLFMRLPPPAEVWTLQNLSSLHGARTSGGLIFETLRDLSITSGTQITVTGRTRGEMTESVTSTVDRLLYRKVYDNIDHVRNQSQLFAPFAAALGFEDSAVLGMVYDEALYEVAIAYREGDWIFFTVLPATAPNVYFETNIDLLGVSWDSVELVTDVSGKPLGKVGGAVGFVIAVVEVGYYTHLFFQSNYRIEQFYYSYKALAAALDFFITLIPIVGPVLQLVTFGTTYVLWRLGLVDEPSTIGDLIMEAIVGSDLSEELEECHDAVGRLEDVSEWLEATFEQHKELGDFFIFAGGVSLAGEVEELCNSV